MTEERDTAQRAALTAEEIAEKIRARKARTRYALAFVVMGLLTFVAGVGAMILAGLETTAGVAILTMGFAMASVGAGYADPSEIKGLWK